jgi:hypothetical protein
MPGLSFSVFKDKIIDGSKTQTIRKPRKYPIKLGDRLQLYWQQRTKNCELLLSACCFACIQIYIYPDGAKLLSFDGWEPIENLDQFAIADGFNNWQEMRDWFDKAHGLPFNGVLIKWEVLGDKTTT